MLGAEPSSKPSPDLQYHVPRVVQVPSEPPRFCAAALFCLGAKATREAWFQEGICRAQFSSWKKTLGGFPCGKATGQGVLVGRLC